MQDWMLSGDLSIQNLQTDLIFDYQKYSQSVGGIYKQYI